MLHRFFRLKRRRITVLTGIVFVSFLFVIIYIFTQPKSRKKHSLLNEMRKKIIFNSNKARPLNRLRWESRLESPPAIENRIIVEETSLDQVITAEIQSLTKALVTETPGIRKIDELEISLFNYSMCLKDMLFEFYSNATNQSFPEVEKSIRHLCLERLFTTEVSDECIWPPKELVGPLVVDMNTPQVKELEDTLPFVQKGGEWSPSTCKPQHKVAIIIPFRDRMDHLLILLRQLHAILRRQQLSYTILVIEQSDEFPFNRGKLMNVGYREALRRSSSYTCFVFHDVDLIPENDLNSYGCPTSPRHLSTAVDKFDYILPYAEIFGGVEMFTKGDFEAVNGFPNTYWGWGAEDDNLYKRVVHYGLALTRPSMIEGRYSMIKHMESDEKPPNRHDKLGNAYAEFETDGLSSLHYDVLNITHESLYTLIKVDLDMEGDMVY